MVLLCRGEAKENLEYVAAFPPLQGNVEKKVLAASRLAANLAGDKATLRYAS